jgi:ribosomal protein L11
LQHSKKLLGKNKLLNVSKSKVNMSVQKKELEKIRLMNHKSKPIYKFQRKYLEKALVAQKPPKDRDENLNLKQLKNSLARIESFSSQSSSDMQKTGSVKDICKSMGIKITRTQEMHILDILKVKDQ